MGQHAQVMVCQDFGFDKLHHFISIELDFDPGSLDKGHHHAAPKALPQHVRGLRHRRSKISKNKSCR